MCWAQRVFKSFEAVLGQFWGRVLVILVVVVRVEMTIPMTNSRIMMILGLQTCNKHHWKKCLENSKSRGGVGGSGAFGKKLVFEQHFFLCGFPYPLRYQTWMRAKKTAVPSENWKKCKIFSSDNPNDGTVATGSKVLKKNPLRQCPNLAYPILRD